MRQGFTLIETLVAISVFASMSVLMVGLFAGFLKNYIAAKKVQKSTESVQSAMNMMAKTIRGSVLPVSPNPINETNQLTLFDVSRSTCIVYKWDVDVLKVASTPGTDVSTCATPSASAFANITKKDEIASISFMGVPSTDATHLGKILILARVNNGAADVLSVQTTISLHNF